jgi:hypothetical protein
MVSTLRLYLLRATYLMVFVFLTTQIWPAIFFHTKPWSLMHGVACCLLAAMAPLMALGLRYPVKMVPILLFELTWKSIWLFAMGLPLWSAHRVDPDTFETIKACAMGVILFPLVIPWRYVFATYVKAPGDRWGIGEMRQLRQKEGAA